MSLTDLRPVRDINYDKKISPSQSRNNEKSTQRPGKRRENLKQITEETHGDNSGDTGRTREDTERNKDPKTETESGGQVLPVLQN